MPGTEYEGFDPVAIVGYGCVFPPDSYDADTFWRNILGGRIGIGSPPSERWDWENYHDEDKRVVDKTYCRWGGFLDDYAGPTGLDELTRIGREGVAELNRTQLMVLDTVLQALRMSGYSPSRLTSTDTALFVGNMLGDEAVMESSLTFRSAEVLHHLRGSEAFRRLDGDRRAALESGFPAAVRNRLYDADSGPAAHVFQVSVAKSVARLIGLPGPAAIGDAACASGLTVIDTAVKYLQDGSHDMVLATGVQGNMNITGNVCFAKIGGLSATRSTPLDEGASGLINGEGSGTVLLKRLSDAVRDGDTIAGVIRGVATRCDGKGKAIYAPSSRGQVAAMRRALDLAGVGPGELDYVETHATATSTGDLVEVGSLQQLYEGSGTAPASIRLGSVKAQIGHTFSAAGMANLLKILLAFQHETVPPTHAFTRAPEAMKLDGSPFRVPVAAEPWQAPQECRPRRALTNAFGFGGVNTSVVVEQYDPVHHADAALEQQSHTGSGRSTAGDPLAVLGIGCVAPYARDTAGLVAERQPGAGVTGFPGDRWHPDAARIYDPEGTWRGGVVTDLDFPWRTFRIPPNILEDLDRAQLLSVMAAAQALDEYGADPADRVGTGVFVGATCGLESGLNRNFRIRLVEFERALEEVPEYRELDERTRAELVEAYTAEVHRYIPPTRENALPGYMDNITAGRIQNIFDLRGPGVVIDDDLCSFGTALGLAKRNLEQGECDVALVGGVHANLTPEFTQLFERRLREAGHDTEGLTPGEGAAFLVVKPLGKVTEDEKVLAVIDGVGCADADIPVARPGVPFFYGADGALRSVEVIARMRAEEQGADRPDLVRVKLPQIESGWGYALRIRRDDSVVGDEEPAVPEHSPQTVAASPDDPGTGYLVAPTYEQLLAQLEQLARGELVPLDRIGSPAPGGYRLGFSYASWVDLARKAQLTLRLLRSDSSGTPAVPSTVTR
ncbi:MULTISPECIES: beta-ketoacyl synthase N-terminal-like domain-containing protein [unclassified Streptomyces]|uniref:beta-ketoacyl synthase N-terminal-like domain-containing protein n=1 Tax=unclassified Streptomyces TaxID=2593676 RepID=UPI002E2CF02D|nr:beta-ketoacyl synthase N-terminal-like domain-containing protein [Streptomyces sp. NBC_00334]